MDANVQNKPNVLVQTKGQPPITHFLFEKSSHGNIQHLLFDTLNKKHCQDFISTLIQFFATLDQKIN